MAHSMIEYLNDSSDSGATSCWKPNTALHENQAFTHLLPESHRKRSPVSTGQVHVSPDGTHHFTGVLMISVRQAVSVWSDWPRRRAIDRQQLTWHEGAARARSSVVRAFASHARGRRFNPCRAHHCLATHTPFLAWCPHHCFAWAAPGSTPGSRLHSLLSCAADCCRKPQVAQVDDIIHAYRLLASTSDLTAWPRPAPYLRFMFSFGLDALRRGAKTSCALVARAGT